MTGAWNEVSSDIKPRSEEATYTLSRRITMSRGARFEAPGIGMTLTSAETCTVAQRDAGSKPISSFLVANLTLTKVIGRSTGHKEPKLPWALQVVEVFRSEAGHAE